MKTKILIISFVFLIAGIISGCNEKKEDDSKITTDIVKNPKTAQDENEDFSELPVIKFEETAFDFGPIIQGEKVSHTFKYKNTGGSNLIIHSAKGSCGCTVPKYSEEPLAPGESGELEVVFDSSGRKGNQRKSITVLANTQPSKTVLIITAEIVIPK